MKPQIYIPENESLTDLLDLVSNSDKLKERTQGLIDLQTQINRDIGDRNRLAKLDDRLSDAEAKVAEAERLRVEADKYKTDRKAEGDAYYNGEVAKVENMLAELADRAKAISQRESSAGQKEAELSAKETDLKNREVVVARESVKAEQMTRDAQLLQEKYLAKLDQVRSIASD